MNAAVRHAVRFMREYTRLLNLCRTECSGKFLGLSVRVKFWIWRNRAIYGP